MKLLKQKQIYLKNKNKKVNLIDFVYGYVCGYNKTLEYLIVATLNKKYGVWGYRVGDVYIDPKYNNTSYSYHLTKINIVNQ